MNDVIKQLTERKSVRAFTNREIDESVVQDILMAAVNAPTAGNQQLYTILRIRDPEILAQLSESCDHQPFIPKGKLVLLFCADCLKWYEAFRYAGCKPRKPGAGDLLLAVDDALKAGKLTVEVLPTPDTWFGLTYHEDRDPVAARFAEMVKDGIYPSPLF